MFYDQKCSPITREPFQQRLRRGDVTEDSTEMVLQKLTPVNPNKQMTPKPEEGRVKQYVQGGGGEWVEEGGGEGLQGRVSVEG